MLRRPIINEEMARQLLAGESVGRRFAPASGRAKRR